MYHLAPVHALWTERQQTQFSTISVTFRLAKQFSFKLIIVSNDKVNVLQISLSHQLPLRGHSQSLLMKLVLMHLGLSHAPFRNGS